MLNEIKHMYREYARVLKSTWKNGAVDTGLAVKDLFVGLCSLVAFTVYVFVVPVLIPFVALWKRARGEA